MCTWLNNVNGLKCYLAWGKAIGPSLGCPVSELALAGGHTRIVHYLTEFPLNSRHPCPRREAGGSQAAVHMPLCVDWWDPWDPLESSGRLDSVRLRGTLGERKYTYTFRASTFLCHACSDWFHMDLEMGMLQNKSLTVAPRHQLSRKFGSDPTSSLKGGARTDMAASAQPMPAQPRHPPISQTSQPQSPGSRS